MKLALLFSSRQGHQDSGLDNKHSDFNSSINEVVLQLRLSMILEKCGRCLPVNLRFNATD
jgi:hypothetical protein